jgi:cell division protease FtsH
LGKEIGSSKDYSEKTNEEIDNEIKRLINEAYAKAKKILEENKNILDKLAETLLEKETITGKELYDLVSLEKPDFKNKKR